MRSPGGHIRRRTAAAGLTLLLAGGGAAAAPESAPLPRPRPPLSVSTGLPESGAAAAETAVPAAGEVPLPRPRPARAVAPALLGNAAASAGELPERTVAAAEAATDPAADRVSVSAAESAGDAPSLAPGSAAAAIDLVARTPRPRPGVPPPGALALVDPTLTEIAPVAPLAPPAPPALSGDEEACMRRLASLGVEFTPMPPLDPGGACEVARPLQVASFGSGVKVAPAATLNCRTTEAVALWVRDVLVPQSRAIFGTRPTALAPGSTYDCRSRNRQAGAKLSEHGRANAFDIMSIAFADRPPLAIQALSPASPEGRFQAAIRESSCAYFTTVLGPGSDPAHHNHLHLDMAQRRGDYRLCSLGEAVTAKTKRE